MISSENEGHNSMGKNTLSIPYIRYTLNSAKKIICGKLKVCFHLRNKMKTSIRNAKGYKAIPILHVNTYSIGIIHLMRFVLEAQAVASDGDDVVVVGIDLVEAFSQSSHQSIKGLFANPSAVIFPDGLN